MPYKLFKMNDKDRNKDKDKVDLKVLIGHTLELQDILRFSEGTKKSREQLHYEDSADPSVRSFEIFIPIDSPIKLLISPVDASAGTPPLEEFTEVTVPLDKGIVIYPRTCHYVQEAGRFMVLKSKGGWKFSREAATPAGNCLYEEKCGARKRCPKP